MGMLGTVINAVAMCNVCRKYGVNAKVFSALHEIPGVCELYSVDSANKALDDGYVCFYAAGTGKPFFSTDTGATMRAVETHCDAILMAKHGTKGVYDSDPNKNPNAKFFKTLSYQQIIDMELGVMDLSAVELVKDSNLELRVFSMSETENIHKVAQGEDIGTTIRR